MWFIKVNLTLYRARNRLGIYQYLALARKWVWLFLLTVGMAVAAVIIYSVIVPPSYHTDATLLVGQDQNLTNTNGTPVTTNIANAYVILATQPPVLQATAKAINWSDTWQSLYYHVSASADGQLVSVTGTAQEPTLAQTIANEVAHQITLQDPLKGQQSKSDATLAFVASQQQALQDQIEASQKLLNDLNAQALIETNPSKIADLNSRITALQDRVNSWRNTYAQLLNTTTAGPKRFISVLAPAPLPTFPRNTDLPQNILLAVLAGIIVGVGGILLLEYLDNTIRDSNDVRRELNLAALGVISRITNINRPEETLIMLHQPRNPIAEAYRVLRTNLRFSGIENTGGLLLVTSANPGEGKTTTSANLAIALAQAGKRVLLVDADLRRPYLHTLFGVANSPGLSDLFWGQGAAMENALQATAVPGLQMVTSGQLPPNPGELFESKEMTRLLERFHEHADIVILDSPPVLAVADASILGALCSGAVLVIDAGHTRRDAAEQAIDHLRATNTKIYGVILNKLNQKRGPGYETYYNYNIPQEKSN